MNNLANPSSKLQYTLLGQTDLRVSEAGFGGYRIDNETDEHYNALKRAILSGINIIDTSSNYMDGASEQLIGRVIEDCEREGIPRLDLVIVTKAGYIQGSNLEHAKQRKSQGISFPDIVELSPDLEHCIHPQFLEDQLNKSLRRLNLTYIDVFLLHNPEYYLEWAETRGKDKKDAHDEYYKRIQMAFAYLEKQVEAVRIRYYGISSNTFPSNPDSYTHTSLQRVLESAQAVSVDHHFKVIQLPMNLYETGAATTNPSVLEQAQKSNLGVLINRPLNAIRNNALIRLADHHAEDDVATLEVEDIIQELVDIEMNWDDFEIETTELTEDEQTIIQNYLSVGTHLQEYWASFQGIEHWKEALQFFIIPRIEKAIEILSTKCVLTKFQEDWLRNYIEYVNLITKQITAYYKSYAASRAEELKYRLKNVVPKWSEPLRLSQMALRALRTTPGVSSVLVGMRQEDYVDDVVKELQNPVEKTATPEDWEKASSIFNTVA